MERPCGGYRRAGFLFSGRLQQPRPGSAPFPDSVSAPAGYQVTYAHNFTTQGMGDCPNGSTANWPAFWSTGSPSNNGEIDMLEGQGGRSCEQTHYGQLRPNGHTSGNSVSNCGPLGSDSPAGSRSPCCGRVSRSRSGTTRLSLADPADRQRQKRNRVRPPGSAVMVTIADRG
jgi:hypothetical protein